MSKYEFSVDGVSVEAVFNKLGGPEGAQRFLRGGLVVSEPVQEPSIPEVADYAKLAALVGPDGTVSLEDFRKCLVPRWRTDENGWIHFTLTSTGETGAQWADWFRENGYNLSPDAEFMLRSPVFQPSPKGTVYEVAVLPGKLWQDADRITSSIRAYCDSHRLKHGKGENAEVGCLIRCAFSDEEIEAMGFTWIITLHEAINDSGGCPSLFGAGRYCGDRGFRACAGRPGLRWPANDGFAVLVSPARNASRSEAGGQVSPSVSES